MWEVRDGDIVESVFDPADHGIAPAKVDDLRGGDVEDNKRIAEAILTGEPGPKRDIVVLGAAAALYAADFVPDWNSALHAAANAIDSCAAETTLQLWIDTAEAMAPRHR
jgi:anthranilate phosphoribosyltransferase